MKISPPNPDISFPALEAETLKRWEKDQTFAKSLKQTEGGKRFTFYDGPPFATGLPHYGHLLQGTIKDIIPRFRTMQGRFVERRFGWDCHGLPVEYELEKDRGIKSRQEILEMGVDTFNEACRAIVLRHAKDFEDITHRLGRWVDFEHDYKTMDPDYMESIWWVVKTLWEKQLLYEGRKSMHVCPRCATPLSNFEVTLGYRDRQDPSVYVTFPLRDDPSLSLVAWTTTPWTLPANVLLAVNPAFKYVEVEHQGKRYVVAEAMVEATFGEDASVTRPVKATELVGQRYEPLFPNEAEGKRYEVVAADAVTDDEGTGVLHVAPAFGEEDLAIGEREKAAFVQHIDITGHVTDEAPAYAGREALAANEPIVADLKKAGRLVRQQMITHPYPHCWRCDTPLLNYATTSWFVAVTKLKEQLISENQQINWTPDHIRDGRFGKWLEGARDWAISRQRFWGNPLPIWRCGTDHLTVIGSLDELEKLSGTRPTDLHKHFVDEITFDCPECGGEAKRIEDVLDCWFESGSMPYAYGHYPFEETESEFAKRFPADFIAEGIDQTRGWFYTLHVLGVALKGSKAFKNVVTTGLVLAEDGKKMSKSQRNFPDPAKVFAASGADAMRLYLIGSPIVRGDDLRFSEKGVADLSRTFLGTLYNSYGFFATYAAVDGWEPPKVALKPTHLLDTWITARLAELTATVTSGLETYDLMSAARALQGFLDDLSNWYVRRSRRRFWKSEDDADKAAAYGTLYGALTTFCRLAAPITPFLTDHIYLAMTGESVHLADWPTAPKVSAAETKLLVEMRDAREAVRLGLAARSQAGVKVRQPLAQAMGPKLANKEIVQMVQDELNVKSYEPFEDAAHSFDQEARPVPKVIATVAGDKTQYVIQAIKKGKYQTRPNGSIEVAGVSLPADAIELRYEAARSHVIESSPRMSVAIDTAVDAALRTEGYARELIRQFQTLRKESGLEVSDRITATIETSDPDLMRATSDHRDLIASEILARSVEEGAVGGENKAAINVDGKQAVISLTK